METDTQPHAQTKTRQTTIFTAYATACCAVAADALEAAERFDLLTSFSLEK